MIIEGVFFASNFEADDEFNDFLMNVFETDIPVDVFDDDVSFHPDVVKYVKDRLVRWRDGSKVMWGKESVKFLIGRAGLCTVIAVDTNKMWVQSYDRNDVPIIKYVEEPITNCYGRIIK